MSKIQRQLKKQRIRVDTFFENVPEIYENGDKFKNTFDHYKSSKSALGSYYKEVPVYLLYDLTEDHQKLFLKNYGYALSDGGYYESIKHFGDRSYSTYYHFQWGKVLITK